MSPVLTIFRKELRSYVMTPYGWVILAFVMALQSVSLSGTLKAFQLAPQKEGILFFILHSPMFWFYFLFIFPLLTMRSLAEEEKTGTLESLLTTPIKTWQVVLGKYFSAYAFYIILWLPMLLYPTLADWSNLIVQWIYGYDAGMVLPYRLADWAGAYAILLLIGAWFTAIGIFASSMTGSQIISGIITIGLLWRIIFAFFGNKYSRQVFIIPFWRKSWWLDLLSDFRWYLFLDRTPREHIGHNPLAQLGMMTCINLLIIMILTGFGMYVQSSDSVILQPFHLVVDFIYWIGDSGRDLHSYHRLGMLFLMCFIIIHLYMVIREEIMGKSTLVSTMFSGFRLLRSGKGG